MIYTVGYEQRDVASFVDLLRRYRVDELVDVRLTPSSRKPGFSKTRLVEALAGAGIEYSHKKELGNPRENRDGFRAGRPAAIRSYRAKLDNGSRAAVEEIVELARNRTIALLCYEREHASCHRRVIVDAAQDIEPGLVAIPIE